MDIIPGYKAAMTHIAFSGFDRLASGTLAQAWSGSCHAPGALIYDTETGRVVDIDPRFPPAPGSSETDPVPRPGRPRLGQTCLGVDTFGIYVKMLTS